MWDPKLYLSFTEERGRPFHELVARVAAVAPRAVADLGCGPGHLTATLASRWPSARIEGVDSAPEMIEAARANAAAVSYRVQDARDYEPSEDIDVIVTNAMLQWVPDHDALLTRWVANGRWLALQVPGNADAPWQELLRELTKRFGAESVVLNRTVSGAVHYARLLREAGCEVDAWETTYVHQLPVTPGAVHPMVTWLSGTALRPVRAALPDPAWAEFSAVLDRELWERYPPHAGVVDFPFLRVFAVAHRAG